MPVAIRGLRVAAEGRDGPVGSRCGGVPLGHRKGRYGVWLGAGGVWPGRGSTVVAIRAAHGSSCRVRRRAAEVRYSTSTYPGLTLFFSALKLPLPFCRTCLSLYHLDPHLPVVAYRAVLEALRCHGVEAALHKQGSIWRVRGGHFVYAEDALLTMSLNMESEGLPMDPDCVPHVTLLFKSPFTPAHANEVLHTARRLGLTSRVSSGTSGSNESAVLAAPAADIAGGTRALYAWHVPATASFEACLESFWTS